MTPQEILRTCEWHLASAIEYDQLIKNDRESAQYHYYGQWPRPPKANRSKHVSYDVLDAVEHMKATFIEMFLSDVSPVKFIERTANDVDAANMAWLYVHDVFTRQNVGAGVLHDVLYDALVLKLGIFKVCWVDRESKAVREFNKLTQAEFDMALSRPNITLDDVSVDYDDNDIAEFSGTFIETIDNSKVEITAVPPENFFLPEQAVKDDEPDFMAERCYPMVSELEEAGYSDEDIDSLEDYYVSDEEQHRSYGQEISLSGTEPYPDKSKRQRKIVYRCVILAEFDKEDGLQYHEVIMGRNGPVLEHNMVDKPGYFWWSPYRIAHKTVGFSVADVVGHIQQSKTTLRRGLIDNVVGSNIPRRLVNRPLLKDINQLTDNRIGGVIEVSDVERAVKELPPNAINPATFEVLAMLDGEKEARSGMTKLSQGTQSEVISHQNSNDLVQSYARLGQKRTAAMAKVFAETCFARMFKYVLELGVQHETQARLVPMFDEMIMVNPQAWIGMQFDLDTRTALLPEQRKADANNYMMLHSALSTDQQMAAIYQDTNKFDVLSNVCKLLGLSPGLVLTNPQSQEYQMAKQMEAQMQQAQMAAQEAQTGWLKAQQQSEIEKLVLESHTRALDAQNKMRELGIREKELFMSDDLERDQLSSKEMIEFAKLKQKKDEAQLEADTDLQQAEINMQRATSNES